MKNKKDIKAGDRIYIQGSCSISHGSTDIAGGWAIIKKITKGISAGRPCRFVELEGIPGHSYNWDTYLKDKQEELKKAYGRQQAKPDPDIDTPWIEEGDTVNGALYKGPSIF